MARSPESTNAWRLVAAGIEAMLAGFLIYLGNTMGDRPTFLWCAAGFAVLALADWNDWWRFVPRPIAIMGVIGYFFWKMTSS